MSENSFTMAYHTIQIKLNMICYMVVCSLPLYKYITYRKFSKWRRSNLNPQPPSDFNSKKHPLSPVAPWFWFRFIFGYTVNGNQRRSAVGKPQKSWAREMVQIPLSQLSRIGVKISGSSFVHFQVEFFFGHD